MGGDKYFHVTGVDSEDNRLVLRTDRLWKAEQFLDFHVAKGTIWSVRRSVSRWEFGRHTRRYRKLVRRKGY
jgi:hypothetical protein